MTLRIFLVDDHRMVRQGLKMLLGGQPDWTICGEAGDGASAIAAIVASRPDIVIMDIGLPKLNGYEATRQIVSRLPNAKVVAVSAHTDAGLVGQMFKAGARGYVPKDSAYEELVSAIEIITTGKTYVSPEVTGFLVDEFIRDEPAQTQKQGIDLLSPTERRVLQLVASGFQSKEIAAELGISPHTVTTHRKALMKKLEASGVADLTRIAILHGLIELK